MTVSTLNNRVSYAGDGTTMEFSFPNRFLADSDLAVLEVNNTTGAQTPKTLITHYTVTGAGDAAGGTITMLVAPATGVTLVAYRDPALTQPIDLVNGDPLDVDAGIERGFDRSTLQIQRVRDLIDRTMRLPEGDTGFTAADMELPAKVDRASLLLGFDADGKPMASAGTGGAATSAFMATFVDDATSNDGLTTLTATRAEAGAVAVPVLNKLREWVTPADFTGIAGATTAMGTAARLVLVPATYSGGDSLPAKQDSLSFIDLRSGSVAAPLTGSSASSSGTYPEQRANWDLVFHDNRVTTGSGDGSADQGRPTNFRVRNVFNPSGDAGSVDTTHYTAAFITEHEATNPVPPNSYRSVALVASSQRNATGARGTIWSIVAQQKYSVGTIGDGIDSSVCIQANVNNNWQDVLLGASVSADGVRVLGGGTYHGRAAFTAGSTTAANSFDVGLLIDAANTYGIEISGSVDKPVVAMRVPNACPIRLRDSASGYADISVNAGNVLVVGGPSGGCAFQRTDAENILRMYDTSNIGLFNAASFGGGVKVLSVGNATTVPTSNPTGGGVLYADAGALKWRGSGGTVTTIAAA